VATVSLDADRCPECLCHGDVMETRPAPRGMVRRRRRCRCGASWSTREFRVPPGRSVHVVIVPAGASAAELLEAVRAALAEVEP
jgi:hypothetical protein